MSRRSGCGIGCFPIPATIARTARRVILHLSDRNPWSRLAIDAIGRLHQLAAPG